MPVRCGSGPSAVRHVVLMVCTLAFATRHVSQPHAQATTLTFEVASVKKVSESAQPAVGRPQGVRAGGGFDAVGTVVRFVMYAYDVADFEVVGGPDWLRTDRFEITARAGREASVDETRRMLRSLLEERFRLRAHTESRQMSHYVLRVAKPDGRLGPQLVRNENQCASKVAPPAGVPSRAATLTGCGPIEYLVRTTSNMLAARVVDETGLDGSYEFSLYAAPERPRSINGSVVPGIDPSVPSDPNLPTYSVALTEQLGLKLEVVRSPVSVVVIETVQQPSEN